MDSGAKELLEIIRKLEGESLSGDYYECTGAANVRDLVDPADHALARGWDEVYRFYRKVVSALEEDLRIVRNELEVYSQSSIDIEEALIGTVKEVQDKASELLKKLDIVK